MRRWLWLIMMIALLASLGCGGEQREKGEKAEEPDMSILTQEERKLVALIRDLRRRVEGSIRRGVQWLRGQANDDGSYPGGLGVTSLAVMAFLKQPSLKEDSIPGYVSNSVGYIAENLSAPIRVKSGLWGEVAQKAMAILALIQLNDPRYKDLVREA